MQTQRLDHLLQLLSAVTAARYSAAALPCTDVAFPHFMPLLSAITAAHVSGSTACRRYSAAALPCADVRFTALDAAVH